MQLCTYIGKKGSQPAIVVDNVAVELAAAVDRVGRSELTSNTDVLGLDGADLDRLLAAARDLASAGDCVGTLDDLVLGPPIPDPEKIVCLGLNYRDHAAEAGLEAPPAPVLFAKFRNSLIGSGQPIVPPPGEPAIDYEGEMAVVIGRTVRGASPADALAAVAAVMPFNDVSARGLQQQTGQWLAGKAIDTFAPCGPVLTTLDEIADIQDLRIQTRVNGELLQDGNTAEMIFSVAEALAFVSSVMTLVPGDIVATGTPAGVGFTREPPVRLGEGDLVEIEVGSLPVLRNPVGAAAAAAVGAVV